MIIVLIESRFTNHKRVHVHEPFLHGAKQRLSIGSQNWFTFFELFHKRTTTKLVHKEVHKHEPIFTNGFMNDRFTNNRFTNHVDFFPSMLGAAPRTGQHCGKFQKVGRCCSPAKHREKFAAPTPPAPPKNPGGVNALLQVEDVNPI